MTLHPGRWEMYLVLCLSEGVSRIIWRVTTYDWGGTESNTGEKKRLNDAVEVKTNFYAVGRGVVGHRWGLSWAYRAIRKSVSIGLDVVVSSHQAHRTSEHVESLRGSEGGCVFRVVTRSNGNGGVHGAKRQCSSTPTSFLSEPPPDLHRSRHDLASSEDG